MQEEQSTWYSGEVLEGDHLGRTIGFPTLNLDPAILSHIEKGGVYASLVEYAGNTYVGALYIGPRMVLGETKRVLEIHVLNFNLTIYGETVCFRLGEFIRGAMNFPSLKELKKQLDKDSGAVEKSANFSHGGIPTHA